MNVLYIHTDKLNYEVKKKTKLAQEISEEMKKREIGECLVSFMAFEKEDNGKEDLVAEKFSVDLVKAADNISCKTLVLYPYAHLLFGKEPSSPSSALSIMKKAQGILSEKGYKAFLVPFGWYKSFEIKAKGHPLSELSREIIAKKGEVNEDSKEDLSEALKKEDKLVSHWHILDTSGELHSIKNNDGNIEGFDFSNSKNLEKFSLYEMAKSRTVDTEPPHVTFMKNLKLASYEPGSDPGNLRYPPKGKMVKALIEEMVTKKLLEKGALEIEAPIMFDYEHPALKSHLNRFPARQYTIQTPNKKVFLRFAACFGQFLMFHDAQLSYKNLPLWMYELTKYSFRVEKRGELTGLRRLRAFTMPDCHAFCADMNQAKEEFKKRFDLSWELQKEIGFNLPKDFEFAIRIVRSFWEENKEFIADMVKRWGKPTLVEIWDEQFAYFVLKYELNFVDALGKASALTTDQIDVENAERYDLNYIDSNGEKRKPLILHLSASGAIERVMYALLEREYLEEKNNNKAPTLPLWLCPTQVRLVPVAERHISFAQELSKKFEENKIRVDIDDRQESISKKIRTAETEWIPYQVVVGDKEMESYSFMVRRRLEKDQVEFSIDELISKIRSEVKNKPFRPLPARKMVSNRPVFN